MPIKTIIVPLRIKSIEPIRQMTREQREKLLEDAGYNVFLIPSNDILIDLLTDSGTGAMSSEQWAAIMRGDESYAGSPSFQRFKDSVQGIMGFTHVIPTRQGRAAERILFSLMCKKGDVVPNNTHFDTARANREFTGAEALDLPIPEALEPARRIVSTAYWGNYIADAGVPIVQPPGGHAIYIDARAFLPHIAGTEFPGVALAAELYVEGGIRSVEIGTLMFGKRDQNGTEHAGPMDQLRLVIPRRVYTQSHMEYVVEVILEVWRRRDRIRGLALTYQAPFRRHFTARFRRLA